MLSNRLPLLIALLLAAVTAGGLTMQLLPIYQAEEDKTKTSKAAPQLLKQESLTETRTHNIASFKLFGDMNKVIAAPTPIAKDLPKTNLKLKLTGVMASTASAEASALIEGPDKKTLNYRIDDELPGGASLKQVYADRVVIERSGRLENLVFVEVSG